MKKKIFFMEGILALMLVFILGLTGCPAGDEETINEENVTNTVSMSGIGNPDVTVRVVFDGVILTWPPIVDASDYKVWRSGGGQDAPILLTTGTSIWTKQANGLYQYYDKNGTPAENVVKRNTQYTYTVLAIPYNGVKDNGKWESSVTTDPPLFGDGAGLTVPDISPSSDALLSGNTVTNYFATINLSNLKPQPDVTYTVERTTLGTNDVPGSYTTVSLSKTSASFLAVGNLKPDIFGNWNFTDGTVYDRDLPPQEGRYLYRLKGVKDSTTEYIYCSTPTVVDLNTYLVNQITLDVSSYSVTATGNWEYTITPGFNGKKGMLRDGDKVVLYWLIGDIADCYKYGPYMAANNVTFSKANLESALGAVVDTKKLSVPSNTSKFLYVQAWLERENGTTYSLNLTGNWSGSGISSRLSNNGQYHLKLNY